VSRSAAVSNSGSQHGDHDSSIVSTARESQIIVSAVGRPQAFPAEWIEPYQIVIDCGISVVDGKTIGDFESRAVSERGARITPVPRGVGAVTNSVVFANLLRAMRSQADLGRLKE
jgi:methylenetetrahydrofolate dehydrogenase (NADP+) / methenyltetrahydrofolate cyclohydrolase